MENEKRLISESERVNLIRCLKKLHDLQFTPGVYEHSVIGRAALFLEETADAVEVVRCKDCKWYEANCETCVLHSDDGDTYDFGCDVNMKPDDFCSYGERRTDNG